MADREPLAPSITLTAVAGLAAVLAVVNILIGQGLNTAALMPPPLLMLLLPAVVIAVGLVMNADRQRRKNRPRPTKRQKWALGVVALLLIATLSISVLMDHPAPLFGGVVAALVGAVFALPKRRPAQESS